MAHIIWHCTRVVVPIPIFTYVAFEIDHTERTHIFFALASAFSALSAAFSNVPLNSSSRLRQCLPLLNYIASFYGLPYIVICEDLRI